MEQALTKSHTGCLKCDNCGSINPFRSDFQKEAGDFVAGMRCRICLGSSGGQCVEWLTATLEEAVAQSTPKGSDYRTKLGGDYLNPGFRWP